MRGGEAACAHALETGERLRCAVATITLRAGRAMTKQQLTRDAFCSELPKWYEASTRNEYWVGWNELLARLPAKTVELRYFDMGDLCDIADWGGNQHGVNRGCSSATRRIR